MLPRQTTIRKRIPTAGVLGRSVLITTFPVACIAHKSSTQAFLSKHFQQCAMSISEMDTLFTLHGIDANKLLDVTIKWLIGPGLRIVLILFLGWTAIRVGGVFIHRSLSLTLHDSGKNAVADIQIIKRRNTLSGLFVTVLRVAVVILAALMVFRELNFEIGPILASAGIVGLAIGFGAQSLVKDVITGAFIVLERQFSVGDVVKIGDRSGVVENLGLRTIP